MKKSGADSRRDSSRTLDVGPLSPRTRTGVRFDRASGPTSGANRPGVRERGNVTSAFKRISKSVSATKTNPADLAPPDGGGFLLEDVAPSAVSTPEDLTEEQRQIAATADRFMDEEVFPRAEEYENQKPGLARSLMAKSGQLGILGVLVPEEYGGSEMDLTTSIIVDERMGRYASFSTTHGAHSGIGTLPLVLFGTEEQKKRYLPRLVTGEWVAAYCLSESHAGSDALAARTRADLSPDGKHYVLNGEKMWISNGGIAGFYTVFAKVDGEKFTAFLIERSTKGVEPGAEEKKMGIKGSSTTPLVLTNAAVPAENVLGEIGHGHIIAFNILNLGRLKLAAACVGGGKDVLAESLRYAKQRKAFGQPIADFGLIQHKLAQMSIRLYEMESIVYRTCGLIDSRLAHVSWQEDQAQQKALMCVEEYAVECSIAKVNASEALDYIVDEGVQIHGGYGFHQDYAVERAYRDSRINRIFEGTNEINRLLTAGMLFKRATHGRLALTPAIEQAMHQQREVGPAPATSPGEPLGEEKQLLSRAKRVALVCAGLMHQRFGDDLRNEQELTAAASDMVAAIYGMESALLRSEKLLAAGRGEQALEMTRLLIRDGMAQIGDTAKPVLAACCSGEGLVQYSSLLQQLTQSVAINSIRKRQVIAKRLLAAEKFVV